MPWTCSSREPSSSAIVASFLIKDLVDVGSGSNDCGRVVGQSETSGRWRQNRLGTRRPGRGHD
jgi:hypothetical protein